MLIENVNVVLVHGAWSDGSSWARVIAPLVERGVKVTAVSLPLTSLPDDAAALERALRRIAGPVVLVGHAYAGVVIAQTRADKVKALVYIAALAADEGEKVVDLFYREQPHPSAPALAPDKDGLIWLPEEAFGAAVAPDASREDLALLAAVQRPISVACITAPVGRPLWRDVPSWFLVAEEDRMIAPATQRFVAERMRAHVRAHRVDHTPAVTAPQAVVDIVFEAIHGIADHGTHH